MKLEIVKGNIIDAPVDAVVLPANEKLKEGSGTSAAIFKAAGQKELSSACKEIGFCKVGTAVPTYGFNLCKYIIHAVVPKWIDGKHNEYHYLSEAYKWALEVGDVLETDNFGQCQSIAFPLLSAGHNHFRPDVSFQIAVDHMESFKAKHLKQAYLVIYDGSILNHIELNGHEVTILPRKLGGMTAIPKGGVYSGGSSSVLKKAGDALLPLVQEYIDIHREDIKNYAFTVADNVLRKVFQ